MKTLPGFHWLKTCFSEEARKTHPDTKNPTKSGTFQHGKNRGVSTHHAFCWGDDPVAADHLQHLGFTKGMLDLGGGNSNILGFSSRTLGKWSNLTNMFQMGWFNHQLVDSPITNSEGLRFGDGLLDFFSEIPALEGRKNPHPQVFLERFLLGFQTGDLNDPSVVMIKTCSEFVSELVPTHDKVFMFFFRGWLPWKVVNSLQHMMASWWLVM